MSAEFSVEYEQVMNAAAAFDTAGTDFKAMIDTMEMLRGQLTSTWLVGLTGNAAAESLARLQAHLQQLVQKAEEMRQDLLATVQDIRDDVDPGMAARFQD